MQNESGKKTPIMPYVLDFAKFLGVFIIMIGVALSLLRVVSVAAAGNQITSTTAAAALGAVR